MLLTMGEAAAKRSLVAAPCAHRSSAKPSLAALTAAALLLPGLSTPGVQAAEEEASLQAGHYQESSRPLAGAANTLRPLSVDSLRAESRQSLADDLSLAVAYSQDTWSGATPITTAPLSANGNRPIFSGSAGHLTISGASPMLTGRQLLNSQYQPVQLDAASGKVSLAPQLAHTLSSASPEVRRQIDLKVHRQLADGAVSLGGGASQERDFQSRFANLMRRWESSDKLSTLSLGGSYTGSDTAATLDHDAAPYITKTAYQQRIDSSGGNQILRGSRQEWAASLGLVQVLNPGALLEANAGFSRSSGYLANPYKVMATIFADPASIQGNGLLNGEVQALLEQRPATRQQWSLGGRLIQHVAAFDAALRLGYRHYRDDWGIKAHTVEVDWSQPLGNGWLVTPSLRYYSQNAADFYSPYLVSRQAYRSVKVDTDGQYSITPFDAAKLPAYFSSDSRLAGFGTLTGGITVAKPLARGVSLEAGISRTRQAGSLKLGGGGEGSYADFSYTVASIAVRFDLATPGIAAAWPGSAGYDEHAGHVHAHAPAAAPAGVMYAHGVDEPGEWMVGYRYQFSREAGALRHGSQNASPAQQLNEACAGWICYGSPVDMSMHMHMLDVMLGLGNGVSLMVVPQLVGMTMNSRLTPGAPPVPDGVHVHTGEQETAGLGDTAIHALFKLRETSNSHWLLALGASVPTGSSGLGLRRSHQQDPGYTHYGMQAGSGTWDFQPWLTYLGQGSRWAWGAQVGATVRLQARNGQGYALGNAWQGSAWVSYPLNSWLAASLRAAASQQGAIRGEYRDAHPQSSAPDFAANYGGRSLDLGIGLNARLAAANGQPSHFGVEWLQPQRAVVNGYQLTRRGSLSLNWNHHF